MQLLDEKEAVLTKRETLHTDLDARETAQADREATLTAREVALEDAAAEIESAQAFMADYKSLPAPEGAQERRVQAWQQKRMQDMHALERKVLLLETAAEKLRAELAEAAQANEDSIATLNKERAEWKRQNASAWKLRQVSTPRSHLKKCAHRTCFSPSAAALRPHQENQQLRTERKDLDEKLARVQGGGIRSATASTAAAQAPATLADMADMSAELRKLRCAVAKRAQHHAVHLKPCFVLRSKQVAEDATARRRLDVVRQVSQISLCRRSLGRRK